jgi:hypothetical protein
MWKPTLKGMWSQTEVVKARKGKPMASVGCRRAHAAAKKAALSSAPTIMVQAFMVSQCHSNKALRHLLYVPPVR